MKEKTKKQFGIKEIAKMAEVSIGTIDRVIHDRPGVSPKTKARVKKIIEEVGYDPNPIARRLAGFNNVYTIAVIIPMKNEFNPYWNQHLKGIEKALAFVEPFGVEVEPIFYDQSNENTFTEASNEFFNNNYDAVVLTPIFQELAQTFSEACHEKNIPLVCIDTDLQDGKKMSFIGQDSYQSGFLAGKLCSLKTILTDYTLICHVKRKELTENFKKRENGFKDYLTSTAGFSEDKILRMEIGPESQADMKKEIQAMLEKNPKIKSIYIPNTRSFLVVTCLTAQQKKDIFITGYDLIDENIALLKDGAIDVLISQKPVEQCYRAIVFLYEKLIAKKTAVPRLDMPLDIIVKENIDYYLQENQQI